METLVNRIKFYDKFLRHVFEMCKTSQRLLFMPHSAQYSCDNITFVLWQCCSWAEFWLQYNYAQCCCRCCRNQQAHNRLAGWNMAISNNPATVTGRVLPPETIYHGQNKSVSSGNDLFIYWYCEKHTNPNAASAGTCKTLLWNCAGTWL